MGRAAELLQLQQWLEEALQGERHIIFITGEPGIGKTTLGEAFVQSLESSVQCLASEDHTSQPPAVQTLDRRRQTLDASLWVAQGQCIKQYGVGEAYLPVLVALERLCRTAEGERIIGLLRRHAPMWLVQMPSLLTPAEREELQH